MKVLVTGSCGYIGSHTVVDLLEKGHEVVSVDDFRNASKNTLKRIQQLTQKKINHYTIDVCDTKKMLNVFRKHPSINSIIHFAAEKSVNESTKKPLKYYQNNTQGVLSLLTCVDTFKINQFVFSSSCSVYGNPKKLPVNEQTPYVEAESPYALTKQIGEIILKDYAKHKPLKVTLLRYFNPAGAHPSGIIGDSAKKPQSLVPLIIQAAKNKKTLFIFGDDYPTRDGSCIRDFIHVCDLAKAHTLALEHLNKKSTKNQVVHVFNLGTGKGVTVKELIDAFDQVTKLKVKRKIAKRRKGDVISIYSNHQKAREELGWKPNYSIKDIMQTAWNFEIKQP